MTFLLGMQAMFMHAPPMYFRSIEAVRLPSRAIVHAINLPPVPLPSPRTSYFSGSLLLFVSFLSSTAWDKKLFAAIKPGQSRRGSLVFLPRTREGQVYRQTRRSESVLWQSRPRTSIASE